MQNLALSNWYWRFDKLELADPDLAINLSRSICDNCEIAYPNPELELLLGEMIANSIDHGVLSLFSTLKDQANGFELYILERQRKLASLSEGWIGVTVERLAGTTIQIAVADSGSGFDYNKYNHSDAYPLDSLHGRGLMIIRELCQSVQHVGNGNCIVVEFDSCMASEDKSITQAKEQVIAG